MDNLMMLILQQTTSVGEDVEKREPQCTVDGIADWCNHYGKLWYFLKKLKMELPFDLAIPLLGLYLRITNNFIDVDRYSEYVSYLLLLASNWQRPGELLNIFQCIRQPHSKELFCQNLKSTKKLFKPLLKHSISHSTSSIHCTNHFLHFSCILPFFK